MPRYQYQCLECGHEFEVKRSFHHDSPAACPQCQGEVRQVYMPATVFYKGRRSEKMKAYMEKHPKGKMYAEMADRAIERVTKTLPKQ